MKKAEVIEYFGSQSAVAKQLGISRASVSKWGETVPVLRALQIEMVTNQALIADPQILMTKLKSSIDKNLIPSNSVNKKGSL